jgi:multiple sugar transport system permease protein
VKRPASGLARRRAREGLLSVLPAIVILLLIQGYPLFTTITKSFTNWDAMSQNDWVGLSNYFYWLKSRDFGRLLLNNVILLVNIPLQLLLGLFVAVLFFEEVKGWRTFRALFYLPQIVAEVIMGYLFRILFSFDGPVNTVLRAVRLDSLAIEWLGNGLTGLMVIVICLVWINIGWQAILLLAGMSSISLEVFDSARLDGANFWQRTFRIVFPMIIPIIEYSLVISLIWTLSGIFPFIYSITRGGPGFETTTLDYMVYLQAFQIGNRLGSASSLAVILLIIILVLTRLQMIVTERADRWRA